MASGELHGLRALLPDVSRAHCPNSRPSRLIRPRARNNWAARPNVVVAARDRPSRVAAAPRSMRFHVPDDGNRTTSAQTSIGHGLTRAGVRLFTDLVSHGEWTATAAPPQSRTSLGPPC